jgi:hypothetical protein
VLVFTIWGTRINIFFNSAEGALASLTDGQDLAIAYDEWQRNHLVMAPDLGKPIATAACPTPPMHTTSSWTHCPASGIAGAGHC